MSDQPIFSPNIVTVFFSFAAGTTDGPGGFNFKQGSKTTNPFWNLVSGLLNDPSAEQEACHAPKPILLNTGEVSTVHIVLDPALE